MAQKGSMTGIDDDFMNSVLANYYIHFLHAIESPNQTLMRRYLGAVESSLEREESFNQSL